MGDGWKSRAQVREMAEKLREANELITKALRAMIPDSPLRCFLVSPGRTLGAAKVIANEAPPPIAAFGRQGPEVQILSLRPALVDRQNPVLAACRSVVAGFRGSLAMGVLLQPAIAHLGKAKHPLDDPDRMFDPGRRGRQHCRPARLRRQSTRNRLKEAQPLLDAIT
jgi:hypothetical protein